jgi:hypothetical protein
MMCLGVATARSEASPSLIIRHRQRYGPLARSCSAGEQTDRRRSLHQEVRQPRQPTLCGDGLFGAQPNGTASTPNRSGGSHSPNPKRQTRSDLTTLLAAEHRRYDTIAALRNTYTHTHKRAKRFPRSALAKRQQPTNDITMALSLVNYFVLDMQVSGSIERRTCHS